MRKIGLTLICLLSAIAVYAEQTEVTVYNQDLGLIKDQRNIELKKGLNKIEFTDVAAFIEPTSVHFVSLTDPSAANILEQNFEFDLVSSDKLLSKYIDKAIKLLSEDGRLYEGTLLSFDSASVVIDTAEGLAIVERPQNVRQILMEKLPEGLITKPTLVWEIDNTKAAKHTVELSYLTRGMSWLCEYVTVLDKDDKSLDLNGWVSVDNRSGVTYNDAKFKLVAGDVRRAPEVPQAPRYREMMMASKAEGMQQFQEQAFFEYHLYDLQRKTTLKNNQNKQISLLNAAGVPVSKEFVFDPSVGGDSYRYYSDSEVLKENARVEIAFTNSKEAKLGMPLPKGKVKVYKKDDSGSLQFVGEDAIKHTPKDEKIRLYIGDAFDVVGERKRVDFREEHHSITETYEISLRNHKQGDIEVIVREKLWRYTNWNIEQSSVQGEKKDASTMEFKVIVPKDGEQKLVYTVKYWW
nr:uncharacterized conserved protein [uncultured bacterium]